ncbi:MAG TPA: inositol monophosphatase family protein, partial [Myxococcota bacterium]|nr:inositol monophosphatase family protein [Myxococcota bacterium]
ALARLRDARGRLKADGTWVTDADLAAQEILREALLRAFPGDRVVSEEDALRPADGECGRTWWVDPIDGTHPFLEGIAHWGPTVALVEDGRVTLGAFYQPRLDEMWTAARGAGAWRDGARLRAPDVDPRDPNNVLLVPSNAHRLGPVPWPGRTRALGCTAAHLALVAGGGCAATVIGRWSPWDVGCGALLVEEAGRRVVTLSGAPFDPMMAHARPFLAAAPALVAPLVAALGPLDPHPGT